MRESWQFLLVPNSFQNDLILKGVWSGGFIAYLPRQESLVSAKVSACRFHQNFRVTSFTIATLLPGARSPVLQARARLMPNISRAHTLAAAKSLLRLPADGLHRDRSRHCIAATALRWIT